MGFNYDYTDALKTKIYKLKKKNPKRAEILKKKSREIIASDEETIEHYKNLKKPLKDLKRVHIDKSFVLTFKLVKKEKLIRFVDFDHHDNIYKKKKS